MAMRRLGSPRSHPKSHWEHLDMNTSGSICKKLAITDSQGTKCSFKTTSLWNLIFGMSEGSHGTEGTSSQQS